MAENNNHEVLEAIHDLATQMDERFGEVKIEIGEVKKDMDERFGEVKIEIGEVKKEISGIKKDMGKLRSDLIDHVERTVNNARGDIIQTIKTDRERQKLFNTKILTILERGKLAKPEEADALRELVA